MAPLPQLPSGSCPSIRRTAGEHGPRSLPRLFHPQAIRTGPRVDLLPPLRLSFSRQAKNLHRRHLKASQLAVVAGKAREFYDKAAKERQKAAIEDRDEKGRAKSTGGKVTTSGLGKSRDAAGKATGVSGSLVDQAKHVLKNGVPELVEAVDEKSRPPIDESAAFDRITGVIRCSQSQPDQRTALCAIGALLRLCRITPMVAQGVFVEVIPMKYRFYVSDPVLLRSDFRCTYCGKDLLSDLDTFLMFARDHLLPKSAGGPDHHDNRVASCAACDRLKADVVVTSIAEARALVAKQRMDRGEWFRRIRDQVRGSLPEAFVT